MDASTANNDDPEFDSMIAIDASMHEETPPQPKYFQGRGSFDVMRSAAECNGHAFCFVQQFPKDVYYHGAARQMRVRRSYASHPTAETFVRDVLAQQQQPHHINEIVPSGQPTVPYVVCRKALDDDDDAIEAEARAMIDALASWYVAYWNETFPRHPITRDDVLELVDRLSSMYSQGTRRTNEPEEENHEGQHQSQEPKQD